MSVEQIKKLYEERGVEYSKEIYTRCIDHTATKMNISPEAVIKNIEKCLKDNNFIGVSPSIWKKSSKDTPRQKFIEEWNNDSSRLSKLNENIISKRQDANLRVCSFNVHFWQTPSLNFAFDDMIKAIDSTQADVLCLQEVVLPKSMEKNFKIVSKDGWIRDDLINKFERLGYKYHHHCESDNENHIGPGAYFGNVVFSKIPIKYKQNMRLEKYFQSRCFAGITISFENQDITIVSVHLDVFDDTEKTRLTQVNQLISDLKVINGPVIICGDFNALMKSDYSFEELNWIAKNNQDVQPQFVATEKMSSLYKEAFEKLKFSAWTGRRIDYVWYRENIKVERSNVLYTNISDHFPLVVDFDISPDIKGKFNCLLWTHNTPYETLYKIITGEYVREFACCDSTGRPFKEGIQFRYGIDSQYGDIIFVMKHGDWWKKLKGVNPVTRNSTDHPFIGHVFQYDFLEYVGNNMKLIDGAMVDDAKMFDFRPRGISGTGKECEENEWNFSWCNLQLHSGSSVPFEMVEKVLFPRWMITEDELSFLERLFAPFQLTKNVMKRKKYSDVLINALKNNLPFFPDGKQNLLNGKFIPYGPSDINDHYQYFRNRIPSDMEWIAEWYGLDYFQYQKFGSTARDPRLYGNSSRLAISPDAFGDAEKIYAGLLFRFCT